MAERRAALLNTVARPRWIKAAMAVVLSIVLLLVVVRFSRDDVIWQTIHSTPISTWAVCLIAFLALHVLSALKWRFYIRTLNDDLPVRVALRCHGAGLFANLCLPSLVGGDLVRAGMALPHVRRTSSLIFAALMDRISDVLGLVILSALGFLLSPDAREFVADLAGQSVAVVLLIFGVGSALVVAAASGLLSRPLKSWPKKRRRKIAGLIHALRALRSNSGRAVAGIALSTGIQGLFVAINRWLGESVGFFLEPQIWFLVWPLAKIAAMAPLSFGGLGVREAAFAILTAPFGNRHQAIGVSLIWQSVLMIGGLISGLLVFFTRRRS